MKIRFNFLIISWKTKMEIYFNNLTMVLAWMTLTIAKNGRIGLNVPYHCQQLDECPFPMTCFGRMSLTIAKNERSGLNGPYHCQQLDECPFPMTCFGRMSLSNSTPKKHKNCHFLCWKFKKEKRWFIVIRKFWKFY